MEKSEISFSTAVDGKGYYTFIDLGEDNLTIRRKKIGEEKEDTLLFFGTISEFKILEKHKGSVSDRVYVSILNMAEYLITAFKKE